MGCMWAAVLRPGGLSGSLKLAGAVRGRFCAWNAAPALRFMRGTARARGLPVVLDPMRSGRFAPFAFLGTGGPAAPPWGKNLARRGARGILSSGRNFFTQGGGPQGTPRTPARAPTRPSVRRFSTPSAKFFFRFYCCFVRLRAGVSFAPASPALRLRPIPCAGPSCPAFTPSAVSPSVGKSSAPG